MRAHVSVCVSESAAAAAATKLKSLRPKKYHARLKDYIAIILLGFE